MHRRTVLSTLVFPLTTAVRRVAAQQTHVVRIGWLAIEPLPELLGAFRKGLQTLGYVEGSYCYGRGALSRRPARTPRRTCCRAGWL